MALPPDRFQVLKYEGRTPDTDAWHLLDMAKLYRCILDFEFDASREVFRIVDLYGHEHAMGPAEVRDAYADAFVAMVDAVMEADTGGEEYTVETKARLSESLVVPYVPVLEDRQEIYPRHWVSPHGQSSA